MVADLSLDKVMLQDVLSKSCEACEDKKPDRSVTRVYRVSIRRACGVLRFQKSSYFYKARRTSQAALRKRIKEIAATRVRYGYRRIQVLLQREGWRANAKRIYRPCVEEGLQIRNKRPKRKVSAKLRDDRQPPQAAADVITTFDRVCAEHGTPRTIRVDSGPEFILCDLDLWAYKNGVTLDFSRPGKPTDNSFVETFNGKVSAECIDQNWFLSLADAQVKCEAFRRDHNTQRPHSSIGNKTPSEFMKSIGYPHSPPMTS